MNNVVNDQYLLTEVTTAPPQRLHLMLLDAAIRFGQRGHEFWQAGNDEQACESLIRSQQIVGEILAGLDAQHAPELVSKVAAVYAFIHRSLLEAQLRRDATKLADALRVLEIERETWRQVCEQLTGAAPIPPASAQPPVAPAVAAPPHFSEMPLETGFSLEA